MKFFLKTISIFLLALPFVVFAEEEKSNWSGDSELGFILKSGNSSSESIYAKQSIIYDAKPWVNTIKLEANNTSSDVTDATGKTEQVRTSERYYASEQVDYFLDKHSYLLGRATWEKDRFSGYDSQATWVLGYGYAFFDDETIKLKTEIGAGESYDKPKRVEDDPLTLENEEVDSETDKSTLVYFREEFKYQFTPGLAMGQDLLIEDTKEFMLTRFHIYLKANLVQTLALKVGYSLRHNDEPPAGKKRKDEEFTTTLTYSF